MIEVTINSFINTLIEAISSSPTSFVTLIAGIIFLIAMIISLRKHKNMGKTLFIIGWLFIILFIIFRYSNHLTTLFDNLINNVFMQIFFPNLATYVIIIAITNFIFLFTILKGNSKTSNKLINSLFFTIIMLLLILVLDVIIKNDINIYEKLTVYSNQTLLILIEATTIFFVLWLIILGSKAIISKLINKSDKKVKRKYKQEITENQENINILDLEKNEASNITSLNNNENLTPINNEYVKSGIPEPETINIAENLSVENPNNLSDINIPTVNEANLNNKPSTEILNLDIKDDNNQALNVNNYESSNNEIDSLNLIEQKKQLSNEVESLNINETESLNISKPQDSSIEKNEVNLSNKLKQDNIEILKL